jgi:hypothetical protein
MAHFVGLYVSVEEASICRCTSRRATPALRRNQRERVLAMNGSLGRHDPEQALMRLPHASCRIWKMPQEPAFPVEERSPSALATVTNDIIAHFARADGVDPADAFIIVRADREARRGVAVGRGDASFDNLPRSYF